MNTITHPLVPDAPKSSMSSIVISLLAVGLAAVTGFSVSQLGTANVKIASTQLALTQARDRTNDLQSQVKQDQAATADLRGQLESANASNSQLQGQLDKMKVDLTKARMDANQAANAAKLAQANLDVANAKIESEAGESRILTGEWQKQLQPANAQSAVLTEQLNRSKSDLAATKAKLDTAQTQLAELQNPKSRSRR